MITYVRSIVPGKADEDVDAAVEAMFTELKERGALEAEVVETHYFKQTDDTEIVVAGRLG